MKELKDIPKDNPFKVPENYFAELEERIMAATATESKVSSKRGRIVSLFPALAVAASIALIVLISYTAFFRGNYGNIRDMNYGITVNDFTDIYLDDIDLITLEDKVAESGLFFERTGVNHDDIIDFLLSENIEVSEIIENL